MAIAAFPRSCDHNSAAFMTTACASTLPTHLSLPHVCSFGHPDLCYRLLRATQDRLYNTGNMGFVALFQPPRWPFFSCWWGVPGHGNWTAGPSWGCARACTASMRPRTALGRPCKGLTIASARHAWLAAEGKRWRRSARDGRGQQECKGAAGSGRVQSQRWWLDRRVEGIETKTRVAGQKHEVFT